MSQAEREPATEELPFARPGADPLVGSVAGSFRILRRIGAGGMGAVYAAKHVSLELYAAVKFLTSRSAPVGEDAALLLREAQSMAALRHPGIVLLLDFGKQPEGRPYLVLELLEGETLSARLRSRAQRPLATGAVLELAEQAATTLAWLHDRGLIHRDLKPSNLFLARDSVDPTRQRLKLLDFGLAQALAPASGDEQDGAARQAAWGTRPYMAPELLAPQGADSAPASDKTDVYALGAVLHELFWGFLPAQAPTLQSEEQELAPRTPGEKELRRLIFQMLARLPTDRPAMAEVAQQLAAMAALQAREAGAKDRGTPPAQAAAGLSRAARDHQPARTWIWTLLSFFLCCKPGHLGLSQEPFASSMVTPVAAAAAAPQPPATSLCTSAGESSLLQPPSPPAPSLKESAPHPGAPPRHRGLAQPRTAQRPLPPGILTF